ncbi:hypothetical protein JOM56_009409 [Amanita muscaria]
MLQRPGPPNFPSAPSPHLKAAVTVQAWALIEGAVDWPQIGAWETAPKFHTVGRDSLVLTDTVKNVAHHFDLFGLRRASLLLSGNFILKQKIARSPGNRGSLGAVVGFCHVGNNIVRTIGSAVSNSLFSLSIDKGHLGGYFAYFIFNCVTIVALCATSLLPRDEIAQERKR